METTNPIVTASYERALRLRKLKPATIYNYMRTHRIFETAIGKPAHEATTFELEALFEQWNDHYADSTRLMHWLNISVFYKFAVERKLINDNPLAVVPRPEIKEDNAPRVLDDKETAKLLKACRGKGSWRNLRNEAIIRCLMTGMRKGECRLMLIDKIDWLNQTVEVDGKTSLRVVYLPDKCMNALEVWMLARQELKYAESPYVWLSGHDSHGNGMASSTFHYILKTVAKKAGVSTEGLNPKAMRHSAVDRAHRAGVRTGDANRIFGWASRSTMYDEVYSRQTAQRRALDTARDSGYSEL